jgi:hypothetical protein
VIGPARTVLFDGPPELAEREQRDPLGAPGGGQVGEERGHRAGELGEQVRVRERLLRVRVVPALSGVVDARRRAGLEHPRHELELLSERGRGVRRVKLFAGHRRYFFRTGGRIDRRPAHEGENIVALCGCAECGLHRVRFGEEQVFGARERHGCRAPPEHGLRRLGRHDA